MLVRQPSPPDHPIAAAAVRKEVKGGLIARRGNPVCSGWLRAQREEPSSEPFSSRHARGLSGCAAISPWQTGRENMTIPLTLCGGKLEELRRKLEVDRQDTARRFGLWLGPATLAR